jgi:hypothetical protein
VLAYRSNISGPQETYEIGDELAVGLSSGGQDLLPGRLRFTVRDVLAYATTEEHRFLADIANSSSQLLGVHLADVLSIDLDGA